MTTETAAAPAALWTPSAGEGLEQFFALRLAPHRLEGADPDELRADLEAHLHEELAREGTTIVTREDLRRVLGKMGEHLPEEGAGDAGAARTAVPAPRPVPASRETGMEEPLSGGGGPAAGPGPMGRPDPWRPVPPPGGWRKDAEQRTRLLRFPAVFFFLAVALPGFTFLFEILTRGGAGVFFDPMPGLPHHLLVLLVPVAGWMLWRMNGKEASGEAWSPRCGTLTAALTGAALAVSGFYTLCFLPAVPAGALGILLFGLGLLVLSPLLAFLTLVRVPHGFLRDPDQENGREIPHSRPAMKLGFLLAVLALAVLEGPVLITQYAISQAALGGTNPEAWASAARTIRRFGSEKALLASCYESTSDGAWTNTSNHGPGAWLASWAGWTAGTRESEWNPDQTVSRDLYFRVTGRPFNEQAKPQVFRPLVENGFNPRRSRLWSEDMDRGGTRVAGRLPGLHLGEGRLDWHCESATGLTWGEWTLTFTNRTDQPEEARCMIALPPGGFVSRVTLWVNGEPQEAAWSTVSKVRAAYQSVAVVQRRDPVLVTQPEAGSVMVQAFPVPARGELKTRISITAPAGADGRVWLPAMVERNFELAPGLSQPFWLQADQGTLELAARWEPQAADENGHPTLTAALPAGALTGAGTSFLWQRPQAAAGQEVFCEDPFAPAESRIVVHRPGTEPAAAPRDVAWVIDTSASLEPHRGAILRALAEFTGTGETAYFLPGDSAAELKILTNTQPSEGLLDFEGGRDNVPALSAAVEWLRRHPDGCLVWLRGPQPVAPRARGQLDQLLDRSTVRFTMVDVPLASGENTLSALFSGRPHLTARAARWEPGAGAANAPDSGLAESLRTALNEPGGGFRTLPAGTEPPAGAVKVSDSLARWHARREAGRLGLTDPAAASAMAASHQIVSPWSGAVVLERAADYKAHGLEQADAKVSQQVPVVPEPSGALLMLLSAGHFLMRRRRRRA